MPNFDPDLGPGGGLFAETGADQRINPGLAMTPASRGCPSTLAPWANNLPGGRAASGDRRAGVRAQHRHRGAVRRVPGDPVRIEHQLRRPTIPRSSGTVAELRLGAHLSQQPERHPEQHGPDAERHVPLRQPGGAQRGGQGARAAQRRADRPVLPHRQLPDPAPGGGLLHAGRRLPDHQRRGPRPQPGQHQPAGVRVRDHHRAAGAVHGRHPRHHQPVPVHARHIVGDTGVRRARGGQGGAGEVPAVADRRPGQVRARAVRPPGDCSSRSTARRRTTPAGRAALAADPRFRVVPAVGAGGSAAALRPFLGIASTPIEDCATNPSHFCR